jgi:hypothetical protein
MKSGGPASAPLGGVLGDPRDQAGLLRGRESASTDRAKGRTGGLGEGAQTRLSEIAKSAACFILFAQCLILLLLGDLRDVRDHERLCAWFQGCQRGKLSKFRQERVAEICRI